MQGTESLLGRYICHLVAHVNETISSATSVVLQSPNVFNKVANILDEDVAGQYSTTLSIHFKVKHTSQCAYSNSFKTICYLICLN